MQICTPKVVKRALALFALTTFLALIYTLGSSARQTYSYFAQNKHSLSLSLHCLIALFSAILLAAASWKERTYLRARGQLAGQKYTYAQEREIVVYIGARVAYRHARFKSGRVIHRPGISCACTERCCIEMWIVQGRKGGKRGSSFFFDLRAEGNRRFYMQMDAFLERKQVAFVDAAMSNGRELVCPLVDSWNCWSLCLNQMRINLKSCCCDYSSQVRKIVYGYFWLNELYIVYLALIWKLLY